MMARASGHFRKIPSSWLVMAKLSQWTSKIMLSPHMVLRWKLVMLLLKALTTRLGSTRADYQGGSTWRNMNQWSRGGLLHLRLPKGTWWRYLISNPTRKILTALKLIESKWTIILMSQWIMIPSSITKISRETNIKRHCLQKFKLRLREDRASCLILPQWWVMLKQ